MHNSQNMDLAVSGFVLLFCAAFTGRTEGYAFIEEPSSMNVTQGSTVSFNCTVTEVPEDQYWRINGKTVHHMDNANRGITTQSTDNDLTYIMTIPAIPTNDDITVQCVLLTETVISSQLAKLRIQGLLSAVSDISTEQINSTSIIVSFTAPPTLLGVPINYYSISISSSDPQTNHSSITNSTKIFLYLQNACIKYWITVSSWNDVGQGDPTTFSVVLIAPPNKPTVIVNQKYISDAQLETVLIATNDVACLGTTPEYFVLEISSLSDIVSTIVQCSFNNISNTSCGMSTSYSGNLTLVLNISEYLQLNEVYLGYIGMHNSAGIATMSIQIRTFDVRNATIVMYKDSYCVICEFIEESRCKGCKIDITEANKATQLTTITVPRFNDASSVTQCLNSIHLPAGTYHVYVSDIESDESYSDTAITLAFSTYNSEENAITTATAVYESLNLSTITLPLLIASGVVCGLALITIAVLVSCLLYSRMKREQLSKYPSKQNLQLKFNEAEPTYENTQEIIAIERAQAKEIQTEECVAYASVTGTQ